MDTQQTLLAKKKSSSHKINASDDFYDYDPLIRFNICADLSTKKEIQKSAKKSPSKKYTYMWSLLIYKKYFYLSDPFSFSIVFFDLPTFL